LTLKARLAAMMILLLVGVVALQALLTQREQQALEHRLVELREQVEESTRFLSQRSHALAALADTCTVESVIDRLGAGAAPQERSIVMVIAEDSTFADAGDGAPRIIRREWTGKVELEQILAEMEMQLYSGEATITREEIWVGADGETTRTAHLRHRTPVPNDSGPVRVFFSPEGPAVLGSGPTEDVLRVHLALPGGTNDATVELLYPVADLKAELEKARRRSWLWLAGLVGVGAAGAVAVAVQFTRPIRALESSFAEVERGNLEVQVKPERSDEIGRLTQSFNGMVMRLKDSRAMETRLAESERLAAVGRLAAGVAHEVRNPLNAMRLTMEQLRAKAAPEPGEERVRFDRYTALVTGELERLERLVGTFLDFSRADEIAHDRLDAADSVRASVQLFAPEAESKGVRLDAEVGSLPIRGDASRLPTVWNNLIANALQATEAGGTVRIRSGREGDEVVVSVEDDGTGIPADSLPRIFEPFYSGRADGTGLGLSLVRAIAEAHGGTVSAESEVGRGTRMVVRLPAEEGA